MATHSSASPACGVHPGRMVHPPVDPRPLGIDNCPPGLLLSAVAGGGSWRRAVGEPSAPAARTRRLCPRLPRERRTRLQRLMRRTAKSRQSRCHRAELTRHPAASSEMPATDARQRVFGVTHVPAQTQSGFMIVSSSTILPVVRASTHVAGYSAGISQGGTRRCSAAGGRKSERVARGG